MCFEEYIPGALSTDIYPKEVHTLLIALGLCNEAGEILDKVTDNMDAKEVLPEIGDVLWYVSVLSNDIEVKPTFFDERVGNYDILYGPKGDIDIQTQHAKLHYTLNAVFKSSEIAGIIKKAYRDNDGCIDAFKRHSVIEKLGQIASSMYLLSRCYGSHINDVLQANHDKLASRMARGVIKGDGDHR